MGPGAGATFSAFATDQFGNYMPATSLAWSFTWSPPGVAVDVSGSYSSTTNYNVVITGLVVGSTQLTVRASNNDGGVTNTVGVTVAQQTGTNPPNCKTNPRQCARVVKPVE